MVLMTISLSSTTKIFLAGTPFGLVFIGRFASVNCPVFTIKHIRLGSWTPAKALPITKQFQVFGGFAGVMPPYQHDSQQNKRRRSRDALQCVMFWITTV